MAIAMAGKQKKEFWRELRHKSGCCCFGWAVYAPWACYMNVRTLHVSKLAKCLLICPGDLVGDRLVGLYFRCTHATNTHKYKG